MDVKEEEEEGEDVDEDEVVEEDEGEDAEAGADDGWERNMLGLEAVGTSEG